MLTGQLLRTRRPLRIPLRVCLSQEIRFLQTGSPGASKFFFPWILLPNSAGNIFKANAPVPTDVNEYNLRIDHQITQNQRIYWRYYHVDTPQTILGYQPSILAAEDTHSYSMALNLRLHDHSEYAAELEHRHRERRQHNHTRLRHWRSLQPDRKGKPDRGGGDSRIPDCRTRAMDRAARLRYVLAATRDSLREAAGATLPPSSPKASMATRA